MGSNVSTIWKEILCLKHQSSLNRWIVSDQCLIICHVRQNVDWWQASLVQSTGSNIFSLIGRTLRCFGNFSCIFNPFFLLSIKYVFNSHRNVIRMKKVAFSEHDELPSFKLKYSMIVSYLTSACLIRSYTLYFFFFFFFA